MTLAFVVSGAHVGGTWESCTLSNNRGLVRCVVLLRQRGKVLLLTVHLLLTLLLLAKYICACYVGPRLTSPGMSIAIVCTIYSSFGSCYARPQ